MRITKPFRGEFNERKKLNFYRYILPITLKFQDRIKLLTCNRGEGDPRSSERNTENLQQEGGREKND